jgi:hypothetical protein
MNTRPSRYEREALFSLLQALMGARGVVGLGRRGGACEERG